MPAKDDPKLSWRTARPEDFAAAPTVLLRRYVLKERLGQGGMGTVYLALDQDLNRQVAVKVLSLRFAGSGDTSFERFRQEAILCSNLNHENIVVVHDVGLDQEQAFIVMEHLAGKSLQDRLDAGALPWREATRVIFEAARGLSVIHRAKLVHRDIKPSNLLQNAERTRTKIADFGLARSQDVKVSLTQPGQAIGTAHYMSPELWRADSAGKSDPRGDIYSLTATYFALLSGHAPFEDAHPAALKTFHLNDPFPDLREKYWLKDLPDAVMEILKKGSEKDAAKRYATATDMAKALRCLLTPPVAPPDTVTPTKKERLKLTVLIKLTNERFEIEVDENSSMGLEADELARLCNLPRCGKYVRCCFVFNGVRQSPEMSFRQAGIKDQDSLVLCESSVDPIYTPLGQAKLLQFSWLDRSGKEKFSINHVGMRFCLIPPGSYHLGAAPADPDTEPNEEPCREVEVGSAFWAAEFPLTQKVVQKFLQDGKAPPEFKACQDRLRQRFGNAAKRPGFQPDIPAVDLDFEEAQMLCRWLGLDGRVYRLPTEAEWEYLARAGARGRFWWEEETPADSPAQAVNQDERVWIGKPGPAEADSKRANSWGLIDVLGNVAEWTCSEYTPTLTEKAEQSVADNRGKRPGTALVVRGGHFQARSLKDMRISQRRPLRYSSRSPLVGMRVLCEIAPEGKIQHG